MRGPAKEPVLVAGASTDRRGIDLGVGAELGLGIDGSVWSGMRVHGCFAVGRMCENKAPVRSRSCAPSM